MSDKPKDEDESFTMTVSTVHKAAKPRPKKDEDEKPPEVFSLTTKVFKGDEPSRKR